MKCELTSLGHNWMARDKGSIASSWCPLLQSSCPKKSCALKIGFAAGVDPEPEKRFTSCSSVGRFKPAQPAPNRTIRVRRMAFVAVESNDPPGGTCSNELLLREGHAPNKWANS